CSRSHMALSQGRKSRGGRSDRRYGVLLPALTASPDAPLPDGRASCACQFSQEQAMRGSESGFTLIEALIAMAVVALLLALAVPAVAAAFAATHSGNARARIVSTLLTALE